VAKNDYQIPGTKLRLEKGILCWFPTYGYHVDPDIYPDPMKFDPTRFEPQEIAKRHPCSFLPFGEGPKVCLGQKFSMIEMKLTLARLLTNYRFILDAEKTAVPPPVNLNKITLHPLNGIHLILEKL
jgi:cytochrome P450 family 6